MKSTTYDDVRHSKRQKQSPSTHTLTSKLLIGCGSLIKTPYFWLVCVVDGAGGGAGACASVRACARPPSPTRSLEISMGLSLSSKGNTAYGKHIVFAKV